MRKSQLLGFFAYYLLVHFLLFSLISFLSQEVFVIVMEELTEHVTHFNTIDYASEVWDQDDIKVTYRVTFSKEDSTDLLSYSKGDSVIFCSVCSQATVGSATYGTYLNACL